MFSLDPSCSSGGLGRREKLEVTVNFLINFLTGSVLWGVEARNTPEWSRSEESQVPTGAEQGHGVETDAEEMEQGTGKWPP